MQDSQILMPGYVTSIQRTFRERKGKVFGLNIQNLGEGIKKARLK